MSGWLDARGFPRLARAEEVREMDRQAIQQFGLPSRVLMELAGAGTAEHIASRLGGLAGARVSVLCGAGNNGGDGYVIARHLADRGHEVTCLSLLAVDGLSGDARANADLWLALGGEVRALDAGLDVSVMEALARADVIVDALFGTGLGRPLEGPAAALVEACAQCERPLKVAVDVPSGVDASCGAVRGAAFQADLTTTYGLDKVGLHTSPGAERAGEVVVVPIGLPRAVVEAVGASARLATESAVARLVPRRAATGHKGTFGHVGVLGGFAGKEGAAQLAALGALRVGAGLATWASPEKAPPRAAEIMHHDLREEPTHRPDVWVVGPGLGQDHAGRRALAWAWEAGRPLVVDADALNLLAQEGDLARARGHVITPHPREAARLLGTTVEAVEGDRLAALEALVARSEAIVVLKGARTLVGAPGEPAVVFDRPTPALAVGGAGDVLAGAAGGLMAQGLGAWEAAIVAVWIHGSAGARCGRGRGERGALASEIADALPFVLGELLAGWS